MTGRASPVTTRKPVKNLPKSIMLLPLLSLMKSSGLAHRLQMALGTGAMQYVPTTSSGSQFLKRAQLRMTKRKPHARMKESEMILIGQSVYFFLLTS